MNSETLPSATSPRDLDGAEASSRRIPVPRGNPAAVWEAPEGEASATGHMGEQIPMDTDDGGLNQFGLHPNITPKTPTVPELGEQPHSKGRGAPILPVTSVQPGAPDQLLGALRGASIIDEHRTLMGMVIGKV